MSKGKKTPEKLAYEALHRLMEAPGVQEHAMTELMRTLEPRKLFKQSLLPSYDDRGVAIVFVSHLEDALESAIASHFTIDANESRRLFSYPSGPLAEFSAKIAMGYALGVYDNRMRDDLRWIKDVRNAFAHVRFEIGFDTPEIQAAVDQLQWPGGGLVTSTVTVPAGGSAPLPMGGEAVSMTARQRFTTCVVIFTYFLSRDEIKPRRLLGTAFYPYPSLPT
jgi:hypothetical protein